MLCICGSGGGGHAGHTPPWDPILLFLHTFSPKSTCIGGPHPLLVHAPLQKILDPPLLCVTSCGSRISRWGALICWGASTSNANLFDKNVCKNERIGSRWGCVGWGRRRCLPGSTNGDDVTNYMVPFHSKVI